MSIAVHLDAPAGEPPPVRYRWDLDTDILTAALAAPAIAGGGLSGSVELAGVDGSWIMLDVQDGAIHGVEIAVWPDVHTIAALAPPAAVQDARIILPPEPGTGTGLTLVQVETSIAGETDISERTIHFRLGEHPAVRAVRLARDILVELDHTGALAGFWLLNVPPFPEPA